MLTRRCPVCGAADGNCVGHAATAAVVTPVDLPGRIPNMANGPLKKYRTGPSSFIKLTEAEARAAGYIVDEPVVPAPEPEPEPEAEAPKAKGKAKRGPAENKAVSGPVEDKAEANG